MAAKTPIRTIQASIGEQFGRRFYLACVSVNELRSWTFRDTPLHSKKTRSDKLWPVPPIVLGLTESLQTSKLSASGQAVNLQLPGDVVFTVIAGHDTISRLADITNGTDSVAVEIHVACDEAALARVTTANRSTQGRHHRQDRSLLDDRGDWMTVTRQIIEQVPIFTGRVDMTKTALSNRSRNLFTFSAIHQANMQLLGDRKHVSIEERVETAVQFWSTGATNMPDWQAASTGKISPADYRAQFVCAHGIALAGLARLGRSLLADFPKTWQGKLKKLRAIDWRRTNTSTWEGRAMIAGRLSKASTSVILTGNLLKAALRVQLSEYENEVETSFRQPLR